MALICKVTNVGGDYAGMVLDSRSLDSSVGIKSD